MVRLPLSLAGGNWCAHPEKIHMGVYAFPHWDFLHLSSKKERVKGIITADSSFQQLASTNEGVCLKPVQEIEKWHLLLWACPEFPWDNGVAFIVAGNPCAEQDCSYLFCKSTGLTNLKVPQESEKEPVELERLTVITRSITNDSKVGDFFPSPETT